jgi:glycosyltransferase involved in cell wall biosynthesis
MDISIVICTHNRVRHLEKCLRALMPQATAATRCEVLVVANACSDGTAALVRNWPAVPLMPLRLIEEPTPGLSIARNAGAAAAAGRTVIHLDDDAVPMPQWLGAYARYFAEHPEVGAGGGSIEPDWSLLAA